MRLRIQRTKVFAVFLTPIESLKMFGGGLQGTSQKSNSALVSRVHSWWIRYPSVYSYSLWWLHQWKRSTQDYEYPREAC